MLEEKFDIINFLYIILFMSNGNNSTLTIFTDNVGDNLTSAAMRLAVSQGNEGGLGQLLQSRDNIRDALLSLFSWVHGISTNDHVEKHRKKINKTITLIEGLLASGKAQEIIQAIQLAKEKDASGMSWELNSIGEILELARTLPKKHEDILIRLMQAVDLNDRRALLEVGGRIVVFNESGGEEWKRFSQHGLLLASAHFGNNRILEFILCECKECGMSGELFASETLFQAFAEAAAHGDLASMKKMVEICNDAETRNVEIGEGKTMSDAIARLNRKFMTEGANALALLLLGRAIDMTGQRSSNLALAIQYGDDSVEDFIFELLYQNPNVRAVIGRVLHAPLQLHQKLERDYQRHMAREEVGAEVEEEEEEEEDFDIPEDLEEFLRMIEAQSRTMSELRNFFCKLFPHQYERNPRDTMLIERRDEYRKVDVPAEFSRDCEEELLRLFNTINDIHTASEPTIAEERARRLAILFQNIDDARLFLKKAIAWARDTAKEHPTVWEKRLLSLDVNWPEDIEGDHRDLEMLHVIDVIMDFKLPAESFDVPAWKTMLLKEPEAAYYVCLAPEIATHLQAKEAPFPETIGELRRIVQEIDMKKCNFSHPIEDRLRRNADGDSASHTENNAPDRRLRSGFTVNTVLREDENGNFRDAFKRLCLSGALGTSTPTGIYFQMCGHFCPGAQSYQTIFHPNEGTANGELLLSILAEKHAEPLDGKVTIDLREIDQGVLTELVKQLFLVINHLCDDHLRKDFFTAQNENFDKQDLNKKNVDERILASTSIEDLKKILDTISPIHFSTSAIQRNGQLSFEVKTPRDEEDFEVLKKKILERVQSAHALVNYCFMLLEGNNQKARILTTDERLNLQLQ